MTEHDDRRVLLLRGEIRCSQSSWSLPSTPIVSKLKTLTSATKCTPPRSQENHGFLASGLPNAVGETFAAVADHVVFAGNRDQRRLEAREQLFGVVELLGFGEVRDVARVHDECRLIRQAR